MKKIDWIKIERFGSYLIEEEKSQITVKKYLHDVKVFANWIDGDELTKMKILAYKKHLMDRYAISSVNSILSSINSFFTYMEWLDLKVKTVKVQRQIFASNDGVLSKTEYERLLKSAKNKNDMRLYLLMQTICSCGLRVSELKYITVESVCLRYAEINCKGKQRKVFLPNDLCKQLTRYSKKQKIKSGAIFITKNGNPLDRSNIWSAMKKLCESAHIEEKKVFPHNLRHLFACTYYNLRKDIVRLADILGHSNINTTRIYTQENGEIHRQQIQCLGLLLC